MFTETIVPVIVGLLISLVYIFFHKRSLQNAMDIRFQEISGEMLKILRHNFERHAETVNLADVKQVLEFYENVQKKFSFLENLIEMGMNQNRTRIDQIEEWKKSISVYGEFLEKGASIPLSKES